MIVSSQVGSSPSLFGQAATFVIDRFIRRRLLGLMEVSESLAQLVPTLTKATVAAVIEAVSAQLSITERDRVQRGVQQLGDGLKLLAWPLGLFVIALLWQLPGGFWFLSLSALVVLLSVNREIKGARAA